MNFKVIRYHNYGMTMSSEQDEAGYEHRFYWSFYQLSNNKIIVLQLIEFWRNNKFVDDQFEYSYGQSELENGTIIKYKFGQDFFEWFDSRPPVKDLQKLGYPTIAEEKCVKEFYSKSELK